MLSKELRIVLNYGNRMDSDYVGWCRGLVPARYLYFVAMESRDFSFLAPHLASRGREVWSALLAKWDWVVQLGVHGMQSPFDPMSLMGSPRGKLVLVFAGSKTRMMELDRFTVAN